MRTLLLFLLIVLPVRAAVVFDGSDDIISFGTAGDTIFAEDQPFSFSCWFNAVNDGESSAGTFIRRGNNIFRISIANALRFSSGSLLRVSVTGAWVTNFFNHVAMTWNGSAIATNVHIYVNGVEVSYVTTTDGAVASDNSADPVVIGSNTTSSTTFNGTLSDVAVWLAVLTPAEVQSLFRSRIHYFPLQLSPSTILAYWPLDDFSNGSTVTGTDTVYDRSTKNRLGSATNGPVARAAQVVSYP